MKHKCFNLKKPYRISGDGADAHDDGLPFSWERTIMNILIFGVSNVGKTTVGSILADKLKIRFHDMDEEVKVQYNTTLEKFVNTGTLRERDRSRCAKIIAIASKQCRSCMSISP